MSAVTTDVGKMEDGVYWVCTTAGDTAWRTSTMGATGALITNAALSAVAKYSMAVGVCGKVRERVISIGRHTKRR